MPMLDFEQEVTNANPLYTKAALSAWVNDMEATHHGVRHYRTTTQ